MDARLTTPGGIEILRNTCRRLRPKRHNIWNGFDLDWITREIAIGNIDDAIRLEGLRDAGISGILSLNGWPNSGYNVYGLSWRCVELIDGHGNPVDKLRDAVNHLHVLVAGGSVLVHCMEGVSRSPLVVASYLADIASRPFDECLEEVSSLRKRVCLQPGLLELRQAYEAAIQPHERIAAVSSTKSVLHASGG